MDIHKRLYDAIHNVLINDWDPIWGRWESDFMYFPGFIRQLWNGYAQEEYEMYVPEIIRLLTTGADREELTDHLHHLETVNMGSLGDRERNSLVAQRLLEVYAESANHQ